MKNNNLFFKIDINFYGNNEWINECKRFGYYCVFLWNFWFKMMVYVFIIISFVFLDIEDCDYI